MSAVGDVCAGLLRHKHILLRELTDTNILDVLVKKGIFNLHELELITSAADSEKCNYFVEVVGKQNGVRLNDLCSVLSRECPKLAKELMNDRHRFIVNGYNAADSAKENMVMSHNIHRESPRSRRSVSQCSCNSMSRRSSCAASPLPTPLPPLNNTVEMYVEPVVEEVLVALSFYATGSYQRPTGDIAAHSIAQPTVSIIIKQITQLLNLPQIQAKYIKFPRTSEERRANVIRFFNKFAISGVLACIDGTHVAIVRPTENEERYYCRKQYHSLNVQLICNADMEIISVDASYGGATHDSFIWANHPLKQHMEDISRTEPIWLLGDSGYALRRYMMTPITDTTPGSPEAHYTTVHVRTRNIIERAIGLLKARFRTLLVHRVLHYSPEVAASIVNACVVLHNMTIRSNIPIPTLTEEEAMQEAAMQHHNAHLDSQMQPSSSNRDLNEGLATRRTLVSRLWAARNPTN